MRLVDPLYRDRVVQAGFRQTLAPTASIRNSELAIDIEFNALSLARAILHNQYIQEI